MIADIKEFCRKIEEEFDELEPGSLTPNLDIKSTLAWNSINALIIMAHISSEYDVNITVGELQKCTTINSLYELIVNKEKIE